MIQRPKHFLPMLSAFAAGLLVFFPARSRAATGTIQDVQHVVILMQENRSFDHYFGALKGVHGFNDQSTAFSERSQRVFSRRARTTFYLFTRPP